MKKSIIATGIIATLLLLAIPTTGTAQTNTDAYIDISTTVEREVTPNELYLQITINEKDYKGKKTLEQMQEAMETVEELERNYHRLAYIMYLFDMPNRKEKKDSYIRQNGTVLEEFRRLGADMDSIKKENNDALLHFKTALKALNKKGE